jgi:uncharacterized protein (TIGR02453 family)
MALDKKTFKFLKDLKKNNDRDWFQANKKRHDDIRLNFIEFIDGVLKGISRFDPALVDVEAKKSVFRIYRDTRFSKDKTPYKTNFGAHMVAHNQKPHDRAGYYIHLEPGNSFLAGGAYMPPGPWMKSIRAEIDDNADGLRKILNAKSFKEYFGEMEGEKLKTAPRDYPKDHPEIELLKFKSFLAVHQLSDAQVLAEEFGEPALKVFKALRPFDDFLNKALEA